ncbi:MAG TPA: DNA replication and repair protein RecF, partial [Blastocatellia bacterium]|nr:DNA replication and repair protein RecF [Blastocatellia bacterium]
MLIERVEVVRFRNLEGTLRFGPGLNIFYGDNAQGKSNWLEAIYVLANTKSFRTSQLRDAVGFDGENAIVRGNVQRGAICRQLQVFFTESSKELYLNGKRQSINNYLGMLDAFVFSMEGMEIVRGEPSERRRFIDRGIVTITPSYLGTLADYNRVVKQKNRLLADASENGSPERFREQIEAWNEQLVDLGAAIHQARADYVERLEAALANKDSGRALFGAERVSVRYRSQLEGKGDLGNYADVFRERLGIRMLAEISAGHSLIGPHRDELEILVEGREIARFGSAGQQRSALFLLDLAQVHIYNSVYEESPVFLIDDIDAELDRSRIEAVLSELEGRVQTLVSTSRRGIADRYRNRANLFYVQAGRVSNDCGEEGLQTVEEAEEESAVVFED